MAWVKLISLDRCAVGKGTFVEHDGLELAVFRFNDPERVMVIDNSCPHASGNLSGGEVKGEIVSCPWHFWEFDLKTGVCTHSDQARVKKYVAEIRDGQVWVDV